MYVSALPSRHRDPPNSLLFLGGMGKGGGYIRTYVRGPAADLKAICNKAVPTKAAKLPKLSYEASLCEGRCGGQVISWWID